MTFIATVKKGNLVLPKNIKLPEGSTVRVVSIEPVLEKKSRAVLGRRFRRIAASASGLPPDLAAQHDHYIHGTPKR